MITSFLFPSKSNEFINQGNRVYEVNILSKVQYYRIYHVAYELLPKIVAFI